MENGMRALIFGATGLVGSELLGLIKNSNDFSEVLVFSRKPIAALPEHCKNMVLSDLLTPEIQTYFKEGDKVFCCIGTTRKKTPNLDEYKKIDYEIPVFLAECCAKNNCASLMVVSAIGANPNSSNFYTRMKGEMERDTLLRFPKKSYFFRPSLLLGNRKEFRLGEKLGIAIFQLMSPLFFGKLKRYKGIEAKKVASAMLSVSQKGFSSSIVSNEQMLAGFND